jgi:hypothetical protein
MIDALEANLARQSEMTAPNVNLAGRSDTAGHNLHLIHSHASGPPCHCKEVGGGSLTYRGHVKPCAICDAWHASQKGQAEAAYQARAYPSGDAARLNGDGRADQVERCQILGQHGRMAQVVVQYKRAEADALPSPLPPRSGPEPAQAAASGDRGS